MEFIFVLLILIKIIKRIVRFQIMKIYRDAMTTQEAEAAVQSIQADMEKIKASGADSAEIKIILSLMAKVVSKANGKVRRIKRKVYVHQK